MYSPSLGRFMQTDPIGFADGMNWYAYVGSDPANWVDPSGFKAVWVCVTVQGYPTTCGFGDDGGMSGGAGKGIDLPDHVLNPPMAEAPDRDNEAHLPCQDKSLGVELGEAALEGLGLLGDAAQIAGAYTGFLPLAAAGTAAEYVSIGGSALLHWSTGDTHGLIEDGANFAAGFAPGGRIARKVGGAAADWGRKANGRFAKGWKGKQEAQDAAFISGQRNLVSGGSICPVKSG